MKNILKSVATIGALATILTVTTNAWFTSSAVAPDNVITTGTLAVSVDSAQGDTYVGTWGAPNAFTVIDAGVDVGDFLPWLNAAPGDTNSYTVAVRNGATIPFKYRAAIAGEWVSGPNFGTVGCPATPANGDASLVQVTNVHQYAATNVGGCENVIGCRNVRDGLLTGPWTTKPGLTALDVPNPVGYYYGAVDGTGQSASAPVVLNPGEFSIYRVDAELSDTADNCYQGATYHFDFAVDATQELAPWW